MVNRAAGSVDLTSTEGARTIVSRVRGLPTSDGAGVRLLRVLGQAALPELDPFLMLDEFGTDNPGDYIAGFPEHPHRGFETVTYMLEGRMRHRDNHGHEGVLVPGSVQWMTAGRGIVHSEMPEQQSGRMRGFQLWLNLPARQKMTAPRYQEFGPEQIPRVPLAAGVEVRLISGTLAGHTGPIEQPATQPLYLDFSFESGVSAAVDVPVTHAGFVYVYEGALGVEGPDGTAALEAQTLGVLSAGRLVRFTAGMQGACALLIAGTPLREPVARYGPFVMNTREELQRAFDDYQNGRF